jgi:hypothetical protein
VSDPWIQGQGCLFALINYESNHHLPRFLDPLFDTNFLSLHNGCIKRASNEINPRRSSTKETTAPNTRADSFSYHHHKSTFFPHPSGTFNLKHLCRKERNKDYKTASSVLESNKITDRVNHMSESSTCGNHCLLSILLFRQAYRSHGRRTAYHARPNNQFQGHAHRLKTMISLTVFNGGWFDRGLFA